MKKKKKSKSIFKSIINKITDPNISIIADQLSDKIEKKINEEKELAVKNDL